MERTDILVVGAGPAGLTAAQYGARAGLKVVAAETLQPGGQALNIDILENYPGLLTGRPGRELTGDMYAQACVFGAVFVEKNVATLVIDDTGTRRMFKAVFDDGAELAADAVILCMGAAPRSINVPGEKEFRGLGVSYCAACDGPFFKGKKIVVVGGGDAACDEARALLRISPNITLVHRRGQLRAQKAVADRVLESPGIQLRFNTEVRTIRGSKKVEAVILENIQTGQKSEEEADAVFIFAGIVPNNELVKKPELTEKPQFDTSGFIITNDRMETSVRGLFCAGDLRATPFRQVVVAAGEGAVAAHSAAEYLMEHEH
ncbi:MAG: FAD-dependent oxidoreductase [Spirochaetaceae bacterium]|jgi:thioredoxin reductase (NADPH)|nr:FAD-dependent oxidoreductase [Spirochaetaceae bacterium]